MKIKIDCMSALKCFIIGLGLFCYQLSIGQTIVGFWGIKEVKVGTKLMTPVAKWTRINSDGSYQSGNGWIQNSEGTWSFTEKDQSYKPVETNGIIDPFGAFQVSFRNDHMIWERNEEGDKVIVTLHRITKLPKSTSDVLVGLWNFKRIVKDVESEKSAYDPDKAHYLFIRWDRIYIKHSTSGEKTSGYWHINGHRPEVAFISHVPGKATESWIVSVNNDELKMTGISDSNKDREVLYERIHEFPE